MPSAIVMKLREIGAKLKITVLDPLPARSPAGKFSSVKKHTFRRMARGRWIPPRERKGKR